MGNWSQGVQGSVMWCATCGNTVTYYTYYTYQILRCVLRRFGRFFFPLRCGCPYLLYPSEHPHSVVIAWAPSAISQAALTPPDSMKPPSSYRNVLSQYRWRDRESAGLVRRAGVCQWLIAADWLRAATWSIHSIWRVTDWTGNEGKKNNKAGRNHPHCPTPTSSLHHPFPASFLCAALWSPSSSSLMGKVNVSTHAAPSPPFFLPLPSDHPLPPILYLSCSTELSLSFITFAAKAAFRARRDWSPSACCPTSLGSSPAGRKIPECSSLLYTFHAAVFMELEKQTCKLSQSPKEAFSETNTRLSARVSQFGANKCFLSPTRSVPVMLMPVQQISFKSAWNNGRQMQCVSNYCNTLWYRFHLLEQHRLPKTSAANRKQLKVNVKDTWRNIFIHFL